MNWLDTPESSNLKCCGYNPKTRELQVHFRSGGHYRYPDVPADVWEDLQSARSKGRFFGERIRSQFTGARVEESES